MIFEDPLTLIVAQLKEKKDARKKCVAEISALERERALIVKTIARAHYATVQVDERIKFRGVEGNAYDRALEEMQKAYEVIKDTSTHLVEIADTMENDPSKLDRVLRKHQGEELTDDEGQEGGAGGEEGGAAEYYGPVDDPDEEGAAAPQPPRDGLPPPPARPPRPPPGAPPPAGPLPPPTEDGEDDAEQPDAAPQGHRPPPRFSM